jgi:hypothetical protein
MLDRYASPCLQSDHERLKRSPSWESLEYRGAMRLILDEPALELRDCPRCGSTLARPVVADRPASLGVTL